MMEKNGEQILDDVDDLMSIPDNYQSPSFAWDARKTNTSVRLDDDHLVCHCQKANTFKTVLGSQIFTRGGKYYFQIFLNKGRNFKIGVSRPDVQVQTAFCDTENGWGIYNGELRHKSSSSGKMYGKKLKQGDIIGVALDMENGILSYYRNGEFWGEAYNDKALRQGELVAAVASMHNQNVFTLRTSMKED